MVKELSGLYWETIDHGYLTFKSISLHITIGCFKMQWLIGHKEKEPLGRRLL